VRPLLQLTRELWDGGAQPMVLHGNQPSPLDPEMKWASRLVLSGCHVQCLAEETQPLPWLGKICTAHMVRTTCIHASGDRTGGIGDEEGGKANDLRRQDTRRSRS
jgi:hypothetical protein